MEVWAGGMWSRSRVAASCLGACLLAAASFHPMRAAAQDAEMLVPASWNAAAFRGEGILPGSTLPTVSLASLRIPERAQEHFANACDAYEARRYDEMDRETARALDLAPNYANVYLLRAERDNAEHHYEDAIAEVLEAQRLEPGVGWAGILLAGAYNGLHRWNDALAILDNLRGAEAETWQAHYERARVAIGLGDIAGGLHWSELALATAPPDIAEVHLVRANALDLAERWSAAAAEIETCLALDKSAAHRPGVLAMLADMRQRAR
jgi:tetratricopeptide (TPR) repeat protein